MTSGVVPPSKGVATPGLPVVRLPAVIAEALLAHARAEAPREACGLIVGSGPVSAAGVPLRYEPCRNVADSPYRYTLDPMDHYRVVVAADAAGEVVWGIAHSHPATPAVPSRTDVSLAAYADAVYLLVSLAREPALRAWQITGGAAAELPLVVEGA
jgi:[CysO sulfur-carrier protein]-S-L-cysteine hydrolase